MDTYLLAPGVPAVLAPWQVPAPGIMVALAADGLRRILALLDAAWQALTLQCADASVGHFIPAIRTLPGFRDLHHENYEVSYHLATASGVARRLLAGEWHPGYLALLVSCQRAAAEHQARALRAYRQLRAAAPVGVLPAGLLGLLDRLGGMLETTAGHLHSAQVLTESLLGHEAAQALASWAQQVTGEG